MESDQPSEDLKCSVSEKTIQGGLWNFGSFFWYILISGLSVWWFCVQLQFSAYFSCIYSQRLALLWIFMTLALSYLCPNSFASAFENDSHPASEMVSFFHSLLLDGSFLFCSFFFKYEEPHSFQGRIGHVCLKYVKWSHIYVHVTFVGMPAIPTWTSCIFLVPLNFIFLIDPVVLWQTFLFCFYTHMPTCDNGHSF